MPKQAALPPTLAPRLVTREVAAAYVCVSPNTFDEMIDKGIMPKARILVGKRKAWDIRDLDMAADALPRDGEELLAADEGWA
jgi:hypothetical protein